MNHCYLGVETKYRETVGLYRFHQIWKTPPFYYEPKKFLEVVFKRRSAPSLKQQSMIQMKHLGF